MESIKQALGGGVGDYGALARHLHPEQRLGNDLETELRENTEQQRCITQLRLRKWLGLPAAGCEDV